MAEPKEHLEVVTARIANLAYRFVNKDIGKVGSGPVLSVVRNTRTGKIYVGLNTGPKDVSDVLGKAIAEQKTRVASGQVEVVHSDPNALEGGHAESVALNRAVLDEEKALGRKLTEVDLKVFELDNVWLTARNQGKAAARCPHCARITRGVAVAKELFVAEGGKTGEINVPQRGSVTKSGTKVGQPVTTTTGTIEGGEVEHTVTTSGVKSTPRGPRGNGSTDFGEEGGGGLMGQAGGLLLETVISLTIPLVKKWFADKYLKSKWQQQQLDMIEKAISDELWRYNFEIMAHYTQIQAAKAAGGSVKMHIVVDTEWVSTDFGPAMTSANVVSYNLLFPGDIPVEFPVFQPHRGFLANLFNTPHISWQRETFDIEI